MKNLMCLTVCAVVALASVYGTADAKKKTLPKLPEPVTSEAMQPAAPADFDESPYRAAAAETTILGWWQFDGPNGTCDPQGWTTKDMTGTIYQYFHVDGPGCHGITAIAGAKSMWCGQWASAEDPWCNWAALPGYGNNWDQRLESTVSGASITYTIKWDSEPGYDYTYVEWWNPATSTWVAAANANGGAGAFDGVGGPLTETLTSPYGATKVRFRVTSDGTASDEDGLHNTAQGAALVDDLVFGGSTEDWEGEACDAKQSADGRWLTPSVPGFGNYAHLAKGASLPPQDICNNVMSCIWAFFDDSSSTNYACGGYPDQGAVPYGPDENGLYLHNEVWSPWIPIAGSGTRYYLEYKDFEGSFDALVFPRWSVRTRDNDTGGCPTEWDNWDLMIMYNNNGWWQGTRWDVSPWVPSGADEIQISLGVIDMCPVWHGVSGSCQCHSYGPLFDQVRVLRVQSPGPDWTVRDIDVWQDNFPELGGISPTSYARCDMAQDILPSNKKGILPGDSLKVVVTDPAGLASDNTGGRTDTKAVYVFVKMTDRFGNPVAGKNGLALQSPDVKRYSGDATGLLRYPFVAGLAPAGWDAYRLDLAKTASGGAVKDNYCGDLMDLAAGPDGPPYHPNENWAANTGVFAPGDVIRYFFGAKNTLNQWSYWHRTFDGQGSARRTNSIAEAMASPCEWSVLPDAGRLPGDTGDILFVDDADDRGGPAQLYFDNAFKVMGIEGAVDRFDVLGPSSVVGNSLAGRVKNVGTQIIGNPVEIYQKVLWNCSDLSRGLMGDGGTPNGGSGAEKSDDFGLCYTLLNTHPDNPGWAYWGDDVVQDWATLAGATALSVKNNYMNHTLTSGDQAALTGVISPTVLPASPMPPAGYLQPTESFYIHGGCPGINDFDVPGQTGLSRVSHRYNIAVSGPAAGLSQVTSNSAASNGRFFLGGFGYNFIRDDDANGVADYVKHLQEILVYFGNPFDEPTGIDPIAYVNRLDEVYPNPFNPTTTIRYSIASAGRVSLRVYNAAGQLVRTLVDEEQTPAAEGFSVIWDATDNRGQGVATGVYFCRLTAKGFSHTKKVVLLQ